MGKMTLRERARRLKIDVKALALCLKDPRLGWPARLAALAAVGYALCPVDLIPDFIPVLGQLDDLIIVPLLVALAVKLAPRGLLDECRKRAETENADSRAKWGALAFVIAVWLVILAAVGMWVAGLAGVGI
jgi:uncharacterized membrane protein YkvA (DUF1232 family)